MNKITKIVLFVLLFPFGLSYCIAQTQVGLKTVEVQGEKKINEAAIEELAFQVLNAKKDEERLLASEELKAMLKNELSKKTAFEFPFDGVKSMSIITPPDSSFRLFNWNIPFNDGTYEYECGILKQEDNSKTSFYFLSPVTNDSIEAEKATTANKQWFPGLFYELIQKETKFQTYYTLLIWEGNDRLTTKKHIDVLWFDQGGDIRFGAPIFIKEGRKKNRIIFEFSGQESMKMNYNSETDQIQFDLLVPVRSDYAGIYEYYFPAITQDAYQWQEKHWTFLKLIDPDKEKKKEIKKYDKELKKAKKELIQSKDTVIKYSPAPQ